MRCSVQQSFDDVQLIARCLEGEDAAWEAMFHRYHPQLVGVIRSLIRGECGEEQAEEIAAAVWCTLCSQAYSRLRLYDWREGRLLGYLVGIARREIWQQQRAERNRHNRKSKVARSETIMDETGRGLLMQEFLATLTRREREFCLSDLLNRSMHRTPPRFTPANACQLRHRVLKKFRSFFFREN
ncbi:MAG: hypothetical protein ACP5XB_00815 [Isosphaeraceae bacterium]